MCMLFVGGLLFVCPSVWLSVFLSVSPSGKTGDTHHHIIAQQCTAAHLFLHMSHAAPQVKGNMSVPHWNWWLVFSVCRQQIIFYVASLIKGSTSAPQGSQCDLFAVFIDSYLCCL